MTEDEIARQVFEILQEFVARILLRMPRGSGAANFHGVTIHGERSPYASFLLSNGDDELCLMVFLRSTEAGLECRADLSAPSLLHEMPACTVPNIDDPSQVAVLLKKVREFAAAQEDRAVEELEHDARRLRP